MDRQLRFVQFHHNGPEHIIRKYQETNFLNKFREDFSEKGVMPWSDASKHRRKFIKSTGRYVDKGSPDKAKSGEIMFWGEWEGVSKVSKIEYDERRNNGFPRYIHIPVRTSVDSFILDPGYTYLESKDKAEMTNWKWQNTDPYVFGNFFIYSNCHQVTNNQAMKTLKEGSVIVMGSKSGVYRADTVFVVGEVLCERYSRNNLEDIERLLKEGIISQTFYDTTIATLTNCSGVADDAWFVLYRGATFDNPYKGMYSFFPCKPFEKGRAFERIPVKYKDYINSNLNMGIKAIDLDSMDAAKESWNSLRDQVFDAGLSLGVSVEEPN